MRIIAGEARGRPLKAPRGLDTRPTSDLLRGVVYAMLAARGVQPRCVLDLYAGSGAMGIEALSRGADHADFVERARAACAVIRANLERTGYTQHAGLLCLPVERALSLLTRGYDLIVFDPPYAGTGVEHALDLLAHSRVLTDDTTVVYEHARRRPPPAAIGPLAHGETRSHGDSSVSFYTAAAWRPAADQASSDNQPARQRSTDEEELR